MTGRKGGPPAGWPTAPAQPRSCEDGYTSLSELTEAEARLDAQAWWAHYRDPPQALAIGRALSNTASTTAGRCAGWWHQAFVLLRDVDVQAGRHALAQAWRAARADGHGRWLARCRDAQALALRRRRRPQSALRVLARNAGLPAALRGDAERCTTHNLAALSHVAVGDLDEALRQYLLARDAARLAGDAALVANTSGNLAGLQVDLLNVEDAASLADEAIEAAEAAGMIGQTPWLTAMHNRIFAALVGGDGDLAWRLSVRMQERADALPVGKRGRSRLLWADAALAVGRVEDAEAWLEASRRHWRHADELLLEWSFVRADLDNRLGRHAQARAVCDAARALTLSGGEEALPYDRMRLYEQGSRACEALGDAQAALRYAREAFAQYEQLAGRATRARRVTAEAQLSLALERRARDEEARRRLAAEAGQQRLASLNLALQQANADKTRFLAAASHDLRQPLHALGLQVANLRAALPDEPTLVASVERIDRSVGALSAMFDALLDISQIEAGTLKPRRRAAALAPLLLRLAEEFHPSAEARGLRFVLRLPAAGRTLHVDTDPALLEAMLRNLLGNALKYTDRGGVMLALRRRHGTPGCWQLQVRDTGPGIPLEWQRRVFDDFVQVGNPERSRAKGLGLGLAIVRRLSGLLAHPLALRSRSASGTVFTLDVTQALPMPHEAEAPSVGASLQGLAVAVVEDDVDALEALAETLQRVGARVLAATDGEALERQLQAMAGAHDQRARAAPVVHALVTDLRLPGGRDGLAVARRLRERFGPDLPVLLMTAELPAGREREGSVAWLGKPAASGAVLRWLREAAARPGQTAAG